MGYEAKVVEVMIASPGDVPQERMAIRDIIHTWNAVHSRDRGVVLMPVGWETHSTPEIGDRPQALINKRILADCDLLIAVFWTRLGTPTGEAASGTVEEIEEHLGAGKPALIYFSKAPVRMDSVDREQYDALVAFKKSLRDRGLIEEYESVSEFQEKVSRHIAQAVIRHVSIRSDVEPSGSNALGSVLELVTSRPGPRLSGEARELLREASQDESGAILSTTYIGGAAVQTNGRNFVGDKSARSIATWRGAIEELARAGLVEDRAGKGEVYFVTAAGFSAAEGLDGA